MNDTIKDYAKISGVKLWQIAEMLGLHDSNFSKKLRHQLTPDEEQKICAIIDQIASKKQEEKRNE